MEVRDVETRHSLEYQRMASYSPRKYELCFSQYYSMWQPGKTGKSTFDINTVQYMLELNNAPITVEAWREQRTSEPTCLTHSIVQWMFVE